jgi:hypothetical protein
LKDHVTGDEQERSDRLEDAQLALPISTLACKLRKYQKEENQFIARAGAATPAE